MFLKNAWYVAAWSAEIDNSLKQVVVLGEKICFFRNQEGEVIALEDACPHRKLPLSKGRIKDNQVECGYHGLTFDCAGQCVWAPGAGRIPSAAKVRPYPVHEKYGLVWIWMGNAAIADPEEIIDIPNFDDPTGGSIGRRDGAEVQLSADVRQSSGPDPRRLGSPNFVCTGTPRVTRRYASPKPDDGIIVHRWMMDVEPAPFYKKIIEFEGKCDRLQHYEVRYPSHALIRAVFTPAGTGGPDGNAARKDLRRWTATIS